MSKWMVRLKDNFYPQELGEFNSIDEAIDEAEASFATEWAEIYDGNDGINRTDLYEEELCTI